MLRRSFQTRIERRLALLFLGVCVVPLVILTVMTVQAIEAQTAQVAKRHLAEHAKRYAMHLVDRLDFAVREVRGGSTDDDAWLQPLPEIVRGSASLRPALIRHAAGFEVRVPRDGVLVGGMLPDDVLFADLSHALFGVRTCVGIAGAELRCAGDWPQTGELIRAQWQLPLATIYETDLAIDVVATQPLEVVYGDIGVMHRVLPYVVFTVMALAGWWVLAQLRAYIAPVAALRSATNRIRQGDLDASVAIKSGDELEGLGEAFNAMASRLSRSFRTMRMLSEMDHMVLQSESVEGLIQQALTLLRELGLGDGVAWLWDEAAATGRVCTLDPQGRLSSRELPAAAPAPQTLEEARSTLVQAGGAVAGSACASIMREGTLSGLIGCVPAGSREDAAATVAELADRLSVAVTSYGRAAALFRQAHYDGLTGLLNREAFNDRLARATRDNGRTALICLDLDRFKMVNDTEGHNVGDRLLREMGQRLSAALGSAAEVARLGGDEFAVLVPRFDGLAEVEAVCRLMIEAINAPVNLDGRTHVTEVSMGVAVYPNDGKDALGLLRKADVAMYKAKEQGGCSFAFYDADMNRDTERRARIEGLLRRGVSAGELCLHFQPKVAISSGEVVGVEGLLRWPGMPEMQPALFVEAAEQTGIIHDMTDMIVANAGRCLASCREAGFELGRVAVNISPRQLQRRGFAEEFLDLLGRHEVRPTDLEIEVTESTLVVEPEAVVADLHLLRNAGITIALDDFGTGYSSLNVLRELPLDTIKIDRSFVSPIGASAQAREFIGRIIDIVRLLGLETVAEGVETARELEILATLNCDVAQGYLFSPAVALPDLLALLGDQPVRRAVG